MKVQFLGLVSSTMACLLSFDASASTVTYELDLEFKQDQVSELHEGWDTSQVCYSSQSCYPTGFRLPTGYFANLSFGQRVSAKFSFNTGSDEVSVDSASIAGWDVFGSLLGAVDIGASTLNARWFSSAPTGSVEVDLVERSIGVVSEGPGDFNYSTFCDPSYDHPELPSGYCGYYGYRAEFEILGYRINGVPSLMTTQAASATFASVAPPSPSQVPLPTAAWMLLAGVTGLVAMRRRGLEAALR